MSRLAEIRKFLVAVVTVASVVLSDNILPEKYATWVAIAVGVLGSLGVHATPNDDYPVEK